MFLSQIDKNYRDFVCVCIWASACKCSVFQWEFPRNFFVLSLFFVCVFTKLSVVLLGKNINVIFGRV